MLGDITKADKIYIACGYTDMRKSIDGDGNYYISNNLAENSIRPFTIGRKIWIFSGRPKGAAASATVYSIIESAKANGLNPYKYLYYILIELLGVQFGQHPEFLEDYLPWSPEVQESCK